MSKGFFDGKHVWVVGASSGIGLELTRLLSKEENVAISISARRARVLEHICNELLDAPASLYPYALDVTQPESITHVHEMLSNCVGKVDILIYVAGINQQGKETYELTRDEAHSVISTNLSGAIACVQAVLPSMLHHPSRGSICCVSSLAGYRGLPEAAVYSASKAGLSNFLEGLRIELRGSGVSVSDFCPGFVDTPAIKHLHHPKPFLMTSEGCARDLLQTIRSQTAFRAVPWILARTACLGLWVPAWLYDWVLSASR